MELKKQNTFGKTTIYQANYEGKGDIIEVERKKEFNGKTYLFCQSSRFGCFYAKGVSQIKVALKIKFEELQ